MITVQGLDADHLCFWYITNIFELYLGYKYNNRLILYYKLDEETNEYINELTKDKDIIQMLKRVENGAKKLHLFVDHDVVEHVSVEVLPPILYLP